MRTIVDVIATMRKQGLSAAAISTFTGICETKVYEHIRAAELAETAAAKARDDGSTLLAGVLDRVEDITKKINQLQEQMSHAKANQSDEGACHRAIDEAFRRELRVRREDPDC